MATFSQTRIHQRTAAPTDRDTFFREHGWTRMPRLVQWMVTADCGLSCPHCLAAAGDGAPPLSLGEAGRLIEQIAALGVEEFLLTGGEPLAREDFPEIVGLLRSHEARWSLNTAVAPTAVERAAIEQWPPAFVAVSLDGLADVHDAFRGRAGACGEALESIAYFRALARDGVAAGTTVTTCNIDRLSETFGLVVESGATEWGLHLLVPEGRAAKRPDLFLSRAQLASLLRFAAARRRYFPVTMADELGYCGLWEALVRPAPFYCGAGRVQCVILPDGAVVPCTTVDRSTSAGNVRTRPLADIWEHGFAEIRSWRPEGRCARCRYASACGGGCWLQRRHGTHCFKDVWHTRLTSKAALAACVGLAAAGFATPASADERAPTTRPRPVSAREEVEVIPQAALEETIALWYAAQVPGGRTSLDTVHKAIATRADDPAFAYLAAFTPADRPKDLASRCAQIEKALTTDQRSLSLIALAWRDLAEWCLDGAGPAARTPEERALLGKTFTKLEQTGAAWYAQILTQKLDPFLRPKAYPEHISRSKAAPPMNWRLHGHVAAERGWAAASAEAVVKAVPFGESLTLVYSGTAVPALRCRRSGQVIPADGRLRPFDVLLVPTQMLPHQSTVTFDTGRAKFAVVIPRDTELTYGDVVRLVDEQNREVLDGLARDGGAPLWMGRQKALLIPALRRLAPPPLGIAEPSAAEGRPDGAAWGLVDLYMF